MGKQKSGVIIVIAIVLGIGWIANALDPSPTPTTVQNTTTGQPDSSTTTPPATTPETTKTTTPAPTPKPTPVTYWASGLKVVDITDSTSRSCTFDMCVFLKVTALKTCSSISLYGTVYDTNDDAVDDISDDFAKLKKGQSRVIEFGTDAVYDSEEYVEYDDYTCWK